MTLPHHSHHHDGNHKGEERAHAEHPAHTDFGLPVHHEEGGGQAEAEPIRVQGDRRFDRVVQEAFDAIVVADGEGEQGCEPD